VFIKHSLYESQKDVGELNMDGCKIEPFSKLEKNINTFNYVREYFYIIKNTIDDGDLEKKLFALDCTIQSKELEHHLIRNCKPVTDFKEKSEWIKKNSKPLRSWLNSLRTLAFFMNLDNVLYYREDINYDLFCKFVEIYDKYNDCILNKIRLTIE